MVVFSFSYTVYLYSVKAEVVMLKQSDIRSVFIVMDGEAIEGDVLANVELIGVVTHIISKAGFDDCPVM